MSRSFESKYPGRCALCGEPFDEGAKVKYTANDELMIDHGCDEDAFTDHRERPVLPRGKSTADRCSTCFQIPASNGVCGC